MTGHRKPWIVRKNRRHRRPGPKPIHGYMSVWQGDMLISNAVVVNRLARKRMARRYQHLLCSPTRSFWMHL